MKKSIVALTFALLLSACRNTTPVKSVNEKADFERFKEMNDYSSYLNEVIKLEDKYKSNKLTEVWIPVRFYDVQPLAGASLFDKETVPILEHLNSQFKAANIQFYLDAPIENVYSSISVDMLYQNRKLENDFFDSHYKADVVNIYIIKNAQDVLGFTHYPQSELQRVFVAEKDLMGASLIHEMGHFLGLLHTFEHVSSEDHSGCAFEGDKICDTPKDDTKISFLENECRIWGTYKDEKGQDLQPDLNNFMSYYGTCRNSFSEQQIKRMNFIATKIKLPQMQITI
jgi:mRNA-degrading endonuclease YafQ of YafQ-DinJ toxin-antitoxin module